MTVQRLDNIGVVVADLRTTVDFFVDLGLEVEGEATVEDEWAAGVVGLPGMKVDIAMLRTPDGHSRLELMQFRSPPAVDGEPSPPPNMLGIRRLMFAVDDIDDVIERLQTHGVTLIGELAQFEDRYRLCYLRGPEGIIVALAQELN